MTLFEALTGGAFDLLTGNIAGNLTKILQKSQIPRGLPGGGWAVLELTGTLHCVRPSHMGCLIWVKFVKITNQKFESQLDVSNPCSVI